MEWKDLMKPALERACKESGIDDKGTREVLIKRLTNFHESDFVELSGDQEPHDQESQAILSSGATRRNSTRFDATRNGREDRSMHSYIPSERSERSESPQEYDAVPGPDLSKNYEAAPRQKAAGIPVGPRSQWPQNLPPFLSLHECYSLTEDELEERCKISFNHPSDGPEGEKRRRDIQSLFNTESQQVLEAQYKAMDKLDAISKKAEATCQEGINALIKQRDDTIEEQRSECEQTRIKCEEGVTVLGHQRDEKLAALNKDLDLWNAKRRIWGPTYRRLREIHEARGTVVRPSMFDPKYIGPSPARVRLDTSSSLEASSSAPVSTKDTSSATIPGSSNTAKRHRTQTDNEDRDRYSNRRRSHHDNHAINLSPRSDLFHPKSIPGPGTSSSFKVPSSAPASAKDTSSAVTFGSSNTTKYHRSDTNDEYENRHSSRRQDHNNEYTTNPSPRPNTLRPEPLYKPTDDELHYHSYIFLPDSVIRNEDRKEESMRQILRGFKVDYIRANNDGFFWVFDNTPDGDHYASECFKYFDGRELLGEKIRLQLYKRRVD